jgi:cystathionine beta-lyase
MKKYDFESIVYRKGTSSYKTNAEVIKTMFDLNYYDDTISMWVADMDFACPPEVIDAIKKRADRKIFGYTGESWEYHKSIIDWYKRRHDMDIEEEWLVFSNGTVTAVRNCLRAFTLEGDGVIIQPPVYYPFEREINDTDRKVVRNNLLRDENNNYSIDFDDFKRKCKDPGTKMFIYCNPHNPTGNIWSQEDSSKLLEICEENNVIFFSDEIHCDIIRNDSSFVSVMNLNRNDNAIVATAVNKTFNVAGLHITNLVIKNKDLRKKLVKYTGRTGISPFAMEASIAAYNDSEEWAKKMNEIIDGNLEYMDGFIKEKLPKIKFNKPSGTYLTWLDFSGYNMEEKELLQKIADEAHLILEGGSMFGKPGLGFIRMNIACPQKVLAKALERLAKVFG